MKKKVLTVLALWLAALALLPGTALAALTDYNIDDNIEWRLDNLADQDQTVDNNTFKDKVQLLVFYRASGCGNSVATIRGLAASQWARNDRIQIIAIEVGNASEDTIKQFKNTYAADCGNMLFVYNGIFASNTWNDYANACELNTGSFAHNFVLADGKIRYAWTGNYAAGNYQTAFDALLDGEQGEPEVPTIPEQPAGAAYNFQISGRENYDEVYTVLAQLNAHRAANGLPALTLDEDLLAAAMQRAAECAVYYNHTRPDGGKGLAIIEGNVNKAENIAIGYPNGTAVMNTWKGSAGHNANMLNEAMTTVGIGCFEYNGVKHWVQLFSSAAAKTPAPQSGSRAVRRDILAAADKLKLQAQPAALTLQQGETAAVQLLNSNLEYSQKTGRLEPTFAAVDNANIAAAELSSGQVQVKALAAGTTTLRLGGTAADGGEPLTVAVRLTVTAAGEDKPGDNTYTVKPDTRPSGSGRRPNNTVSTPVPAPTQPANKVEIPSGTMKKSGLSAAGLDAAEAEVAAKYIDVKQSDWFVRPVAYVHKLGLMNGMREDEFAPSAKMTRGMLVTMLYRLAANEGSAAAGSWNGGQSDNAAVKFSDVPAGLWYSDAVGWAAQNGVVNGVADGKFAPNDNISREQLAAVLYRYAQYKGYDVSAKGGLDRFIDGKTTSAWAVEPMQWAVGCGLLDGLGEGMIVPYNEADRAEVATMIMRFCEKVINNENAANK